MQNNGSSKDVALNNGFRILTLKIIPLHSGPIIWHPGKKELDL